MYMYVRMYVCILMLLGISLSGIHVRATVLTLRSVRFFFWYTCVHTCMYMYVYVCILVYVCIIYVCKYVCVYVSIDIWVLSMRISGNLAQRTLCGTPQLPVCVCVCLWVCVCVCVCVDR